MVDGLLKAGANPNIADSDGATPLIAATKENLFPAVKSLISKYALIWPLDFLFALVHNSNRGAKVLAKDKKGKQALDYASELGFNDIQY